MATLEDMGGHFYEGSIGTEFRKHGDSVVAVCILFDSIYLLVQGTSSLKGDRG
jgi:hypothetical protein